METYALDPRRWRIARVFGRNPLLRSSDRIEALVVVAAVVVSLVALPVVSVVGIAVYGARDRLATEQARTRHAVMATVTDTKVANASVVQAMWHTATGEHFDPVRSDEPVRVGDHLRIWLDDQGNQVAPPVSASSAVAVAVVSSLASLVLLVAAMTSLVAVARMRLDRARDAQWDREIRCLQDDNGGRKNHH